VTRSPLLLRLSPSLLLPQPRKFVELVNELTPGLIADTLWGWSEAAVLSDTCFLLLLLLGSLLLLALLLP